MSCRWAAAVCRVAGMPPGVGAAMLGVAGRVSWLVWSYCRVSCPRSRAAVCRVAVVVLPGIVSCRCGPAVCRVVSVALRGVVSSRAAAGRAACPVYFPFSPSRSNSSLILARVSNVDRVSYDFHGAGLISRYQSLQDPRAAPYKAPDPPCIARVTF